MHGPCLIYGIVVGMISSLCCHRYHHRYHHHYHHHYVITIITIIITFWSVALHLLAAKTGASPHLARLAQSLCLGALISRRQLHRLRYVKAADNRVLAHSLSIFLRETERAVPKPVLSFYEAGIA